MQLEQLASDEPLLPLNIENHQNQTNFRVAAKNFFLTYPQSTDLPHQRLHDHLQAFPHVHNVFSCREKHAEPELDANGNQVTRFHHHAVVQFSKKLDTRNPRYFDITYEGITYHCQVQAAKSLIGSVTYVEKDGETLGDSQNFQGETFAQGYDSTMEQGWFIEETADEDYVRHRTPAHQLVPPKHVRSSTLITFYQRMLDQCEDERNWAISEICQYPRRRQQQSNSSKYDSWLSNYWKMMIEDIERYNDLINKHVLEVLIETSLK